MLLQHMNLSAVQRGFYVQHRASRSWAAHVQAMPEVVYWGALARPPLCQDTVLPGLLAVKLYA